MSTDEDVESVADRLLVEGHLPMWTIYNSPADYPGLFVVRRHFVVSGGVSMPDPRPWAIESTLTAARVKLPEGLNCVGREPDDQPSIVETWL